MFNVMFNVTSCFEQQPQIHHKNEDGDRIMIVV